MADLRVNIAGVPFENPLIAASGTFGFTSGEGLVNEFTGNGKIYIQTRNVHNLADALRPFFPSSSSNS